MIDFFETSAVKGREFPSFTEGMKVETLEDIARVHRDCHHGSIDYADLAYISNNVAARIICRMAHRFSRDSIARHNRYACAFCPRFKGKFAPSFHSDKGSEQVT